MATRSSKPGSGWLAYLSLGILFGITLTKAEVLSWFRIQEMFRFQSPRMYLIIVSAILTAGISLELIRRFGMKTVSAPKVMGRSIRYAVGGTIFGLGWALAGACPGPLFALLGNGMTVILVAILSGMAGTWLYGVVKLRLPH